MTATRSIGSSPTTSGRPFPRYRTLRAAHGGKNLGSFPAIIVALTMVATAAVTQR